MLYDLEPGLKKHFERHRAYEMFQELKLVFQDHARLRGIRPLTSSLACKMEENGSVSEQVLKYLGCYNRLNQVGVSLPDKIVIDRVL